ncbi:MAG TPA: L-threonylcarbamoyladenylate synthase [Candidatus Andersenbacteria bacterium]|nr:L-threonylcarbamoyladenylate synthase [Candidatus Andersenbacteria bacterium]
MANSTYTLHTTDVSKVIPYIKEGRVVAFPTGTSYGLAADALQGHALQRVRNLKQRPADKSFTIFLDEDLWDEYLELRDAEKKFLTRYATTALTLLVKPKESLMHLAQDDRIGLRVIDHPMMRELAERAQVPLTATSANISGQDACYDVDCIDKNFPGRIGTTYDLSLAAILDGGQLHSGLKSTIVKLESGRVKIIRPGALVLKEDISGS